MKLGAAAVAALATAAVVALVATRGAERPERTESRPTRTAWAPRPTPIADASPPSEPARDRPAAAGGVALLASASRAEAVVVGTVSGVAPVDTHGWRADLRIDETLEGGLRVGQTITIAWEELASARRIRFEDGARVLVVLDPLPTQSLWRRRFPTRDQDHPVLVVAASGESFLTSPDPATLDALSHYLALAPVAREEAPGATRLAEVVAAAQPSLAHEALALLAGSSSLAGQLGDDGGAALLGAARDPRREPALRAGALRLAAEQHLTGTRETALALIETEAPIRADAYRALASLDGAPPAERVEPLLADRDAQVRVAAIELGGSVLPRDQLLARMREDDAPAVRLAAGRALLARHEEGGIRDVVALLDDPDATVRNGIAESLGARGAAALGPLSAVVDDGSERAALAAVLGLSKVGKAAGPMLKSVSESHRYPSVRALAKLALGEALGHKD